MTYQFYIRLQGFANPEIWRRMEVPSNFTFYWFHKAITIAFDKPFEHNEFTFSPSGKGSKPLIIPLYLPFDDHLFAKTTLLSTIFMRWEQSFF